MEKEIEIDRHQEPQDDSGSSDACEDDKQRQLLQNDTEILLGVLPARVWASVTKLLLGDNCTDDLKNLCDASPYFRDLMLSKRVLFLFPEVLKIFGPQLENEERASEDGKSSILTCRSTCKFWNKSVDYYINEHGKPDFFQAPPPQSRDPGLVAARYKYFGFMAPLRLQKFLDYFGPSHQPSVSSGPQRNPFIGSTVALCNDAYSRLSRQFGANMVSLLRKYGQFIRIMDLGVLPSTCDQLQDYFWLKECLQLVPNLNHLKVKQRPINQNMGECIEMDPYFGEHAYRTVGTAEYLRRRIFTEFAQLPAETISQIYTVVLETHQQLLRFSQEDEREQNYDIDEHLAHTAQQIGRNSGLWRIYQQEDEQRRLQQDGNNANEPARLNGAEYRNAIAGLPLPKIKNLECLNLCRLYARLFNPLIQSNQQISWLHVEPIIPYHWLERYVDWWKFDFPNLRKLYIKFSGGPEEVRRLREFHPSFMALTSLHFEYPQEKEYMGWAEIFQILEEKWRSTLTELKIRLPEPKTEEDKADVKNVCENGRLSLLKLKKLVVFKNDHRDDENFIRSFQCWNSVRENLDEFMIL